VYDLHARCSTKCLAHRGSCRTACID
jgi:hypothetical protein